MSNEHKIAVRIKVGDFTSEPVYVCVPYFDLSKYALGLAYEWEDGCEQNLTEIKVMDIVFSEV